MTLERQMWWDSLPVEEKRVRDDIDEFKRIMKFHKKNFVPYIAYAKYHIRYSKKAIQALRKQIAMRPVIKKEFKMFRYCPICDCILNVSKARPFCDKCGQKIRW